MDITQYPTLPQTPTGWGEAFSRRFNHWSAVDTTEAGTILSTAFDSANSFDDITSETIYQHVILPLADRAQYVNVDRDNQTIIEWIEGLIEDASDGSGGTTSQAPQPGEITTAAYIEALAPFMDDSLGRTHSTTAYDQFVSVVDYQFSNWKRGTRTVPNMQKAKEQFSRRMSRQHGWSLANMSSVQERYLGHVMETLRKIAAGEDVKILPVTPSRDDVMRYISKEAPALADIALDRDPHRIGRVAQFIIQAWRTDSMEPWSAAEAREKWTENWQGYYSLGSLPNFSDEEHSLLLETMLHLAYGSDSGVGESVDGVKDADSLLAWLLEQHTGTGSLQTDAIRDGVADWVDTVKDNPDSIAKEGLAMSLRRQVRSYGFTKFTGKAMRSTLESTLAVIFDAHKGAGLTVEEWKARWERRDRAVSYVSGRYGEQNDLCSVLEKATAELGIEPVRKPKHKMRFKGSGVLVEVEVESWMDDEYKMQRSAQEQWSLMSADEREAAVVERHEPYVNWSDMIIAR